ncbi:MAG: radical SAM family heme chaperone HemW [Pseudomonadales bacterium]
MSLSTPPPLSLYVHIPWCVRKCPYCDFNSHAANGELPEALYIERLLVDFEAEVSQSYGRPLQSIFIGGGTPSLFSAGAIADLLDGINRLATLAEDVEITLEANPGTWEQERFSAYRAAGVNRLSLGVQSFNDGSLKQLGRIHDSSQAHLAIAAARKAGFDNLNIDLMHGLPNQTRQQAIDDLETALDYAPWHLSWYQLTIEPNTEFYSRPPVLPNDDSLADIEMAGMDILSQQGLHQYEVSAYAKEGKASQHNLNYWQFGDYFGIGAGAHGKLSHPDGKIERRWKTRAPKDYLSRDTKLMAGNKILAEEDLALEFLMNALRLKQGVADTLLAERTGIELDSIKHTRAELIKDGLLQNGTQLATTELGYRFLDSVLGRFNNKILALSK